MTSASLMQSFYESLARGVGSVDRRSVYVFVGSGTVVVAMTVAGALLVMRRVSASVGTAAPTKEQLEQEHPQEKCAIFRHLPSLATKLAWRSLGASESTPIHKCEMPNGIEFYVKREDLISNKYGGNKVRTLQHQLAVCEARRERGDKACKQLVPIGSGGSNQIIATVVHARELGWDNEGGCAINPCWFDSDKPDLDNTLNMLSTFSFPIGFSFNWGMKPGFLEAVGAIWGAITQDVFLPLMLGGNCPVGVLGQVGGVLELAEQIHRRESPDPNRIYLAIGSGCTASGLILGVVLTQHLGLNTFQHSDFKIVVCNVHHGMALGDRLFGFHVNPFFGYMPLTIQHSVFEACNTLKRLGGPDLTSECRSFIQNHVELRSREDVVGKYGGHSDISREAAQHYDDTGVMTDYLTGKKEKEIWVCGHFVAKALQPLVSDLEKAKSQSLAPSYMLWQTKSAVQPLGPLMNEWEKMQMQNETVKKWANEGKAESKLRAGKVSTKDGTADDYRSIMTTIDS